ncbi:MAG: hypothetical protein ACREI1_09545 [Nitrospiraceae bacterium]
MAKVIAELKDHTEVLNSDNYCKGWIVLIDLTKASEVDTLITSAQYEAFLASQKH